MGLVGRLYVSRLLSSSTMERGKKRCSFYFPFPFLHPLLLFVTMASRVLANNDDNDINYRETKGCVEFTRNLATRGLTIKLRLIKLFLNLELLNINC